MTTDELTEYFEYLDELRESGQCNMFGCGEYLQRDFGLGRNEAREVALKWMSSFDGESDADVRAERAL